MCVNIASERGAQTYVNELLRCYPGNTYHGRAAMEGFRRGHGWLVNYEIVVTANGEARCVKKQPVIEAAPGRAEPQKITGDAGMKVIDRALDECLKTATHAECVKVVGKRAKVKA